MELTELEILSEKEDICGREDFFKLLFTWKKIAKTLEFLLHYLKKNAPTKESRLAKNHR